MTPQEFLEYLRQHDVTVVGDLSQPPFELLSHGEVLATFHSQGEVVARLEREDADLRQWELRHGLVEE